MVNYSVVLITLSTLWCILANHLATPIHIFFRYTHIHGKSTCRVVCTVILPSLYCYLLPTFCHSAIPLYFLLHFTCVISYGLEAVKSEVATEITQLDPLP